MALRIPSRVVEEARRPAIRKGEVDRQQRRALGEISNVSTNVHTKFADLKLGTQVRSVRPAVGLIKKIVTAPTVLTEIKTDQKIPSQTILKAKEEVIGDSDNTQSAAEIEDIDKIHPGNLFLVSEYAKDVYSYLLSLEVKFCIKKWPIPNSAITSSMRTILIDWLMDIHLDFNFLQETMHSAVAILDRYVQENPTLQKNVFQLVGICALSLAGKYEETSIPAMGDFLYMCKNAYTRDQMMKEEIKMLSSLDFRLGRPVSVVFLRRFNMAAKADKLQHCFSKYFIDLVLLDSDFCHVRPSLVAAAAAYIAMCIQNGGEEPSLWTPTMVHYSSYKFSDVHPVAALMAGSIIKSYKSKYDSVRRKYAQSSLLGVSMKTQTSIGILKKIALAAS